MLWHDFFSKKNTKKNERKQETTKLTEKSGTKNAKERCKISILLLPASPFFAKKSKKNLKKEAKKKEKKGLVKPGVDLFFLGERNY